MFIAPPFNVRVAASLTRASGFVKGAAQALQSRDEAHDGSAPRVIFPVLVPLGPWRLHPHFVFEAAAYALGLRLYLAGRRPGRLSEAQNQSVIAGAIIGAAFGAKALDLLVDPAFLWAHRLEPAVLLGGKTIVGGLLGGVLGVETAKKLSGTTVSTGDDLTLPLIAGMALGRVGCFLTGLADNTQGTPTSLPWGVDFGDGVARHPASLYEALFLIFLGLALAAARRRPAREGDRFKAFMCAYLLYRLLADFWKPYPGWLFGLGGIQAAALAGLFYYASDIRRLISCPRSGPTPISN